MRVLSIIGKVIEYISFVVGGVIVLFAISILLINAYTTKIMDGQGLWLCMLIAYTLTVIFDFEMELEKRGKNPSQS